MPDLSKLPVPLYAANQPYHWEYDNLPLKALSDRDVAINNAVNIQEQILLDSAGSQASIASRLDNSIEQNGDIKTLAIDDALHNIAKHTDDTATVSTEDLDYYVNTLGYSEVVNPVPFVRMIEAERAKIAGMAEGATSLSLEVCTDILSISCVSSISGISCISGIICTSVPSNACFSNVVNFDNTSLKLHPSEHISWEVESPNIVRPVLNISVDFAHRHYYDLEPITTDYINYQVTSVNTNYVEGSLRVYVNGIKLNSDYDVLYWDSTVESWFANHFTPSNNLGTFILSNAITENDVIRIDFDVYLI